MKKYKKCCLRRERLDVPERIAPPAGPPPELIRQLQERDAAVREWTRRYGHVRPCISADFQGHKFLAAGSRLYWSNDGKPWIFVPDFLLAYIPGVFGKEWGDAELAKPEPERHPLVHWRVEAIRYMNAQPRQPDGSYVAPPSGPLAAYMAFAFNLFAIEDNSRLDDFLLERLKNKDQFQGARHEVFAEATCLRAGFSIEREDQGDRTRRHVEFTAKHKSTGQLISVEAKSRHRPGVLGRPGIPQPHEKLSIRFGGLLNDAIAKNPAHPLVVFVDTNLPFRAAERVLGRDPLDLSKPTRIMRALLDRNRDEHDGVDLYAMLVFTNHPHHYVASTELDPQKHILSFIPQPPKVGRPEALFALNEAVCLYGNIPNQFPP